MTAWVSEGDRIACRWTEVGQGRVCGWQWMGEVMHGSYLPPPPDFASHSPFGGATWFTPHLNPLPDPE
jgi:hypothetical protein